MKDKSAAKCTQFRVLAKFALGQAVGGEHERLVAHARPAQVQHAQVRAARRRALQDRVALEAAALTAATLQTLHEHTKYQMCDEII